MIVIGKINSNLDNKESWIDDSVKPKKGQLGYVDKSFITLGEEGFNVAKVRLREERIPAIGDKMASRAGQKGTIGLIIPEADMPYLEDGTRPDLIINPHALPSRMTIGQIVESMFGIACVSYGGFGDCTAFQVKGSNYDTYGPMLTKAGFNHTGNHIMYNGMTGEQIQSNIYMGPTYYMRLKHMVKDKINYRARGPNQQLTRQPVQGRANDGGLRIGEMERDGICAHGLAYFLNESFLVRGDEYYMAVCNKTGSIAIYNEAKNLFLSPYSDGPIKFHTNPDGTMNIKNLTKFGRSFSLLRIPYSFKLLIQELQVMNIQMRIITDENIDQLLSMSYSNNINKLLHNNDERDTLKTDKLIKEYVKKMNNIQSKTQQGYIADSYQSLPTPVEEEDIKTIDLSSQGFIPKIGTNVKIVNGSFTDQIGTVTGIQADNYEIQLTDLRKVVVKKTDIEEYIESQSSPLYAPYSPAYVPDSSTPNVPESSSDYIPESIDESLPFEKSQSILELPKEVEENKTEENKTEENKTEENKTETKDETSSSDSSEKKIINIQTETIKDNETKKITF